MQKGNDLLLSKVQKKKRWEVTDFVLESPEEYPESEKIGLR